MKNFTLQAALLLCLSVSCGKAQPPLEPIAPEEKADSVTVCLILSNPSGAEVKRTDIFVYEQEGTGALCSHKELHDLPDTLKIRTTPGKKTYVGICNFPFKFNLQGLQKYDSMELLTINFQDDDPSVPLLSGQSGDEGIIALTPLLCSVTLSSVSNALDGYELLENPRVWLSGINPFAEVLRSEEFRLKEELENIEKTQLPNDIGFYTQYPGTTLYCYPNDTPETILGTERTVFNFECEINGETCRFTKTLPPMPRGSAAKVDITVYSGTESLINVLRL